MNPPPKSIFKSKSAFAGALSTLVGAAGTFIPDIGQILSNHANTILMGADVINVILQAVSHGLISLFE